MQENLVSISNPPPPPPPTHTHTHTVFYSIGFSIAKRLVEDGARVMVSSRKEKNVARAVERLKGEGGVTVAGTVCHVGEAEQRKKLIEEVSHPIHHATCGCRGVYVRSLSHSTAQTLPVTILDSSDHLHIW